MKPLLFKEDRPQGINLAGLVGGGEKGGLEKGINLLLSRHICGGGKKKRERLSSGRVLKGASGSIRKRERKKKPVFSRTEKNDGRLSGDSGFAENRGASAMREGEENGLREKKNPKISKGDLMPRAHRL